MTDFDRSQIKATFMKISAWGKAIEAGNNGQDELLDLQAIAEENPLLLSASIDFSDMCQSIAANFDEVAQQRLDRIQVLKTLLWPNDDRPSSEPEVM